MINLETAKLHLRVDHDDEDTLITGLIQTAQAAVTDYLNLDSLVPLNDAPSPISAAMLLLIGDLYENREASSERQLHRNPTYERLLNPYRVMGV